MSLGPADRGMPIILNKTLISQEIRKNAKYTMKSLFFVAGTGSRASERIQQRQRGEGEGGESFLRILWLFPYFNYQQQQQQKQLNIFTPLPSN